MTTMVLLLLVKVAITTLIVAVGASSTVADVVYLWQRPALLLRSLVAMYLLIPLAAFILVQVWSLVPGVEAALLVLAVSAGAPLLPRKLKGVGNDRYAFSLVVTTSLLAIIVVPVWVGLLARYFGVATEISAFSVAKTMAAAFLLPLAVGFVLRALAPAPIERFAGRAIAIAGIALTASSLLLLVTHWQLLLAVGANGSAALLVLMLIALATGHVLGGPVAEDRTALALACVTRHIGIAVVVATTFQGPRTTVMLAAYVVVSALVSIPYLQWRRRVNPDTLGSKVKP